MDNARIHTGGAARYIEDTLYNTVVDGRALRILIIWLPARSPELNPIELVFGILAKRLRSWRWKLGRGPRSNAVVKYTQNILDNMDAGLVTRCIRNCGYNV
jgi:transposase